jgi:hypothetical protein
MIKKIKEWLKNDHYQVFNSLMSVIFGSIIAFVILYLWGTKGY